MGSYSFGDIDKCRSILHNQKNTNKLHIIHRLTILNNCTSLFPN